MVRDSGCPPTSSRLGPIASVSFRSCLLHLGRRASRPPALAEHIPFPSAQGRSSFSVSHWALLMQVHDARFLHEENTPLAPTPRSGHSGPQSALCTHLSLQPPGLCFCCLEGCGCAKYLHRPGDRQETHRTVYLWACTHCTFTLGTFSFLHWNTFQDNDFAPTLYVLAARSSAMAFW